MAERTGIVTFKGGGLTLIGPDLKAGDDAPNVPLVDNDLKVFHLASLKGKTVILLSVPSLDTSVCSLETKRFNQEAAALGPDVQIVVVSMDLPFAQNRWCGAEGVDRVRTLSDYRGASFGRSYGVLIKELYLLARAVFVVDASGTIRYVQVVPEIAQEPDYDAVLKAVKTIKA